MTHSSEIFVRDEKWWQCYVALLSAPSTRSIREVVELTDEARLAAEKVPISPVVTALLADDSPPPAEK